MMRTALCVLFLLFQLSYGSADLYLSPTGSDSSVTCSVDDPCLTLRHAVDIFALTPSSLLTLVLNDGTYSGPSNMNIQLPSDVATVIRGANPNGAVIDNTNQSPTADDTLFLVSNQLTLQDIVLSTVLASSDAPAALRLTADIPQLSIQNTVVNGMIDTTMAAPESFLVHGSELCTPAYQNSRYLGDIQISESLLRGQVRVRGQSVSITNSQFPDSYSLSLESNSTTLRFAGNQVSSSMELIACSFEITDSTIRSAEHGNGDGLNFLMPEWCPQDETVVVRNCTIEDFGTGITRYPDLRPFRFEFSDLHVSVRRSCIKIVIASFVNVTNSHFTDCYSIASVPSWQSMSGSQFVFDDLMFNDCLFTNTGPISFPSKSVIYPIPTRTLVQNCEFDEPQLPIADIQTWGSSTSFLNCTVGAPGAESRSNISYIQVASNLLEIDGCTFDGQGADRIVHLDASYSPKITKITNSVFQNTRNCSVYADHLGSRQCTVENSQFTGFDGAGICYSSAYNDSSKPFVPLSVNSCQFSDAPGVGMVVAGAARISGCTFDRVSRGITTNTSLNVMISDSRFTQNDDVAIAAGADSTHPGLVKVDNLDFDHCKPWAINCTNQVAILLSNPSSLSFDSGSATDNINTKTCEVRPPLPADPQETESRKLPGWAIALIVIAGLIVILLPILLIITLAALTGRRRRKDEFEFEINEDEFSLY